MVSLSFQRVVQRKRRQRGGVKKTAATRKLRVEDLEIRQLLSIGPTPGQVFRVDFDGAQGVSYNGPIHVGGIDVPAFQLPAGCSGRASQVEAEVVARLNRLFDGEAIRFMQIPPTSGDYSTIYVGGTDQRFAAYGSFFGLAEAVDVGNANHCDKAFVFSQTIASASTGVADFTGSLTTTIAHEAGHLLGLSHENRGFLGSIMAPSPAEHGSGGVLDEVAYNADAHIYAASQALIGLANIYSKNNKADSLPWDPTSFVGAGADIGAAFIRGAGDEDYAGRSLNSGGISDRPADKVGLRGWYHSYDPDHPDRTWLYSPETALDTAQEWVGEAFSAYSEGDAETAWYDFGRAVHLVQDMTVPAHVLEDPHPWPGDSYETFVSEHGKLWTFDDSVTATTNALMKQFDASVFDSFDDFFNKVANFTKHYDSDECNGIADDTGARYVATRHEYLASTLVGYLSPLVGSLVHKHYLDNKDLNNYASVLYTNAMAYSAALINCFIEEFKPSLDLSYRLIPNSSTVALCARPENVWPNNSINDVRAKRVEYEFSTDGSTWTSLGTQSAMTETSLFVQSWNLKDNPGRFARARVLDQGGLYSDWQVVQLPAPDPTYTMYVYAMGVNSLHLSWEGGAAATSYTLQRWVSGSGWTSIFTCDGNTRQYDDQGLNPGTDYDYRIQSTNPAGSSDWAYYSGETYYTPPQNPIPPGGTSVEATPIDATTIRIVWCTEPNVTYQLERSESGSGSWQSVGPVDGSGNYTDSGLKADTSYDYRLIAANSAGQFEADTSEQTPPGPHVLYPNPMDRPCSLRATPLSSYAIQVSFTGSAEATNYKVTRSDLPDPVYVGSAWSFVDTSGIQPGHTYLYTLVAMDDNGNDTEFDSVSTTGWTPPLIPFVTASQLVAPIVTVVDPDSSGYDWTEANEAITLTWQPVQGATRYAVEWSSSPTGPWNLDPDNDITTQCTYTSWDIPPGTRRYFRVMAQADSGEVEYSVEAEEYYASGWSNVVNGMTPTHELTSTTDTPSTPAGVAAHAQSSSRSLITWGSSDYATHYTVQRATSSTGPWQTIYSGSEFQCVDVGLAPSTPYYYRVDAVNPLGSSNWSSAAGDATQSATVKPAVPSGLAAAAQDDGAVQVSWGNSTADGFLVERAIDANGPWEMAFVGDQQGFVDSTVAAGQTYYYRVSALTDTDQSYPSSIVAVTAPGDGTRQLVVTPDDLDVVKGGSRQFTVKLAVKPAADATVTISAAIGSDPDLSVSAATLTFTAATWSTPQTVTVTDAANADADLGRAVFVLSSDTLPTASVTATEVDVSVPNPPAQVAASDDAFTDKVEVKWAAVGDATDYEIWRNTSSDSSSAVEVGSQQDIAGTTYEDTTAVAGTQYWYWVKAKNAAGASDFSAADQGRRAQQPIGPPSISGIVVAEAGTTKNGKLESGEPLKITWAASGQNGIASQKVTIDSKTITPIGGPYSGLYYSCQIGTFSVGSHSYKIQATDSKGVSSSVSGSFAVLPAPVTPPSISGVVVAEAATPKNGILESSDSLKITWAASSPNGIAAQSLQVDGSIVTPINGPYGGLYYSCQIGKRGVRTHSYTITTTDKQGVSSTSSGTFAVVAPAPPAISAAVVAEASTPKNGILESNETLKITWAASSSLGIASQVLTVDGGKITPIAGPYSGLYYSCQIGTWKAGDHSYQITTTDSTGGKSTSSGTFHVVAATVIAPTIADVVVAEAGAAKNGILETGDALKITWSATGTGGIASQTMQINGTLITPINGPYGGKYYSCPIGKWGAGSHPYKITATDSKGVATTYSGTFVVVAPAPPTIAGVVVAEAGATKNGILESNEPLKITWAASSASGIASQFMQIDGAKITPIGGPYGGLYYSCQIGTWAAGSHSYKITSTDPQGAATSFNGTFLVVNPSSSIGGASSAAVMQRADLLAAVMREMDGRNGDSTSDDLLDAMLS